jgi:hypothetical protein
VLSSLAIVGDVFKRFQEVRLSLKTTNDHQDSDESEKRKETSGEGKAGTTTTAA